MEHQEILSAIKRIKQELDELKGTLQYLQPGFSREPIEKQIEEKQHELDELEKERFRQLQESVADKDEMEPVDDESFFGESDEIVPVDNESFRRMMKAKFYDAENKFIGDEESYWRHVFFSVSGDCDDWKDSLPNAVLENPDFKHIVKLLLQVPKNAVRLPKSAVEYANESYRALNIPLITDDVFLHFREYQARETPQVDDVTIPAFLAPIVDSIRESIDIPKVSIACVLIAVFGGFLGGRASVRFGAHKATPYLFLILFGEPDTGKSTLLKIAQRRLYELEEDTREPDSTILAKAKADFLADKIDKDEWTRIKEEYDRASAPPHTYVASRYISGESTVATLGDNVERARALGMRFTTDSYEVGYIPDVAPGCIVSDDESGLLGRRYFDDFARSQLRMITRLIEGTCQLNELSMNDRRSKRKYSNVKVGAAFIQAIQPKACSIFTDDFARDQGGVARAIVLPFTSGRSNERTIKMDDYYKLFQPIRSAIYGLDEGASALYIARRDEIDNAKNDISDSFSRYQLSKMKMTTLQLALIFHCMQEVARGRAENPNLAISADTMRLAIEFGKQLLKADEWSMTLNGEAPLSNDETQVLNWLKSNSYEWWTPSEMKDYGKGTRSRVGARVSCFDNAVKKQKVIDSLVKKELIVVGFLEHENKIHLVGKQCRN